jgi:hypothetical protein
MATNKMLSNRFQNESGNEIYLRITEEPIQGTPGMLVYLAGPDSDTEMHITKQEGRELLLMLSKFLKAGR